MAWPDAKIAAQELTGLLKLPEGRLDGYRIQLTEYEDENVYRFACGGRHGWPITYYRQVTEAMYRELHKRGAIIERHMVTRNQIIVVEPIVGRDAPSDGRIASNTPNPKEKP